MPRYRRRPIVPDLLPPLVGLVMVGILFLPGFKQLLFTLALGTLGCALLGLIGWLIWKRRRSLNASKAFSTKFTESKMAGETASTLNTIAVPQVPELVESFWSLELLRKLEWKRFEDLVAAYAKELDQEARTTRIGPDGGVDIEILDRNTRQIVMLVQCKAWNAYKVGIKPLRELFGVMAAANIKEGAFFTTGEFTHEAVEFARENGLDMVDGREFLIRMGKLPSVSQKRLLVLSTEGDYITPTCPRCGTKMVLRTSGRGRNSGEQFWGCRSYPRCHQSFKLSSG